MVEGIVAVSLGGIQVQTVRNDRPLMAHFLAITLHTIVIVDVTSLSGNVNVTFPRRIGGGLHGMACQFPAICAIHDIEHQIFTVNGVVLDIKSNFHDLWYFSLEVNK